MAIETGSTPRPRMALDEIGAKEMKGGIAKFLLDQIQGVQKPWPQMSEHEQQRLKTAVLGEGERIARAACRIVAAQDFLTLEVTTRDFNKKGDVLEAKLKAVYSPENLDALARATEAGTICLSVIDPRAYLGEGTPIAIMRDQPDLGLGEVDDEADEAEPDAITAGDDTGDGLAERAQNDALGEGEVRQVEETESEAEPDAITAGDPGKTKRARRATTTEERVAARARAAEQEPPPKRTRGKRQADAVVA